MRTLPHGPFGGRRVGEMAGNPQAPAIAAAVYDAVGIWATELPITPDASCGAGGRGARSAAGWEG
jgi:CO/xanthine dehydrogenase Mo-binding subunit